MEVAIYLALGLLVGLVIGILVIKGKKNTLTVQYEVLRAQKEQLEKEVAKTAAQASAEKESLQQQHRQQMEEQRRENERRCEEIKATQEKLRNEQAEHNKQLLDAQEERHDEALANMKSKFEETIKNLQDNVKAVTEDMLKSRQKEFSEANKTSMEGIVAPLNETIEKMKEAMNKYTNEQNAFSGTMKANLETIIGATDTARKSAEELTTALKHDSKVQGDYGEAILDEILKSQGFTEGVHYELQYVMKDETGKPLVGDDDKGLRPDVLFHLDTKRDVIIDSKVNLTDFINYANAKTPEERKACLEKHVKSIENQVKLLSQKNYFKYHKKTSSRMDYVIMFVPISAAWWEALREKPSLWREAMDNNVYIADEQTLFAALRIIKLTWTQIAQVDNQKKVFDLAAEMVNRVGQFMKSYKAIGDSLANAQKAYDKGNEKLTPGGKSILTTAQNLLKLGAADSKTNPVAPYLDVDNVEQLPEPVVPTDAAEVVADDTSSDDTTIS